MNLQNIKKLKNEKGFTIVELLIVIVVIGILAAIVIVAYQGVTNRAKTTKSSGLASSVMKKAEAYAAEEGTYPTSITALTGAASTKSYYISTNDVSVTTNATTAPTKTNGETTVQFAPCGTGAGVRVSYFDFANDRATTNATNPASPVAGAC